MTLTNAFDTTRSDYTEKQTWLSHACSLQVRDSHLPHDDKVILPHKQAR